MKSTQIEQRQSDQMIQIVQEMNLRMREEITIRTREFQNLLISYVDDNLKFIINNLKKNNKNPLMIKIKTQKLQQNYSQIAQQIKGNMKKKNIAESKPNEQQNIQDIEKMPRYNHILQIQSKKIQKVNAIESSMQSSKQLTIQIIQQQHTLLDNVEQQRNEYTLILANQLTQSQINPKDQRCKQQNLINYQMLQNKFFEQIDLDKFSDIQFPQNKSPQQKIKQLHYSLLRYEKFKKLSDQFSNPWIKKINNTEQNPIFMIDLTNFKQNQKNKLNLKKYLKSYKKFQKQLKPIFVVQKIQLKSNFDKNLLNQILSINWNGLKQIILQNNQWHNNMKQNQLKKFLQLADNFSNQTTQISIVIQIKFLSSSYLKVLQQIDFKSKLTLKIKYLNQNHQKILRKDNFKVAQNIILEFKALNEEILIDLSDFQQFQEDFELGYQKSCLVEYSSKTLTKKYDQLKKILFQSVISTNKVQISPQQIEQNVLSMYQIQQNKKFRLNLFFSFDLQTIFQQFDWEQIQIIHFTKIEAYEIQYSWKQLDCEKLAKFKKLKYVLIDIELLRNKQVHPKLININSTLKYLDQKAFKKIYQYSSKKSSIPIIILENYMDQSLIGKQLVKESIKKFSTFNDLIVHYSCRNFEFQYKKIQQVKQPQEQQAKKQISSSDAYNFMIDKDLQINFMKAYKNLQQANKNGQYSPCTIF